MKKIMLAVAIVGAAMLSHGAATYWTCTYVAKSAENYVNGGLAYFVVGDATDRSDILGLTGKGVTAISTALADSYSFAATGTDGNYSVKMANAVANSDLGLTDSTTGNKAFLVIFDTATITESSKYYATDVQTFATMGGSNKAQIKWGDQETASSAAGAWKSVANVPEPTSGILLVLGMAGLALRRRRA